MSKKYDVINTSISEGAILQTLFHGKVFVIKFISTNKPIKVKFLNTGYIRDVQYSHLRRGNIKDPYHPTVYGVGFIGEGNYKINSKIGVRWEGMLRRCYDDSYHANKPTYRDCEVSEDWQDLQKFASWYENTYPCDGEDYELDKDFTVLGNRVYSEETCNWIPRKLNSFFINFSKISGTSYDKRLNSWVSRYSRFSLGGKGDVLIGNYDTQEEARCAYLSKKMEILLELINKYHIPKVVVGNMKRVITNEIIKNNPLHTETIV